MARNWSLAITFDECVDGEEQVSQIVESAARCLINISRETAEDIRQQIDYHYTKETEW